MLLSNLAEDVVEEILSRVPAKSLKRFQSTCKQWNPLFNDDSFTKKHFEKAAKEALVLMVRNFRVYSVSFDLSGIHNNIDHATIKPKGEFSLLGDYNRDIFHCNGLLLCTKNKESSNDVGDRVVAYNPCTRQTKWIELSSVHKEIDKIAFGYKNNESGCHSYKILMFTCYKPVFDKFNIYEFSSNSWRVLYGITRDWNAASDDGGLSFKGNTYWIASDRENILDELFVLRFDFTEERFQRLRLPFTSTRSSDMVVLSTVREEQLAVLFKDTVGSTMGIWLTNKIDDDEPNNVSWCMFFKVDLHEKYRVSHSMSFVVDEENKLAVCCDRYLEGCDFNSRIYISREDEFRQVDLLGDFVIQPKHYWTFLFTYVPSLVQI
ncbi:unnamed protein product [Microthlaspi erraticum]|uniref:F-box domain-containing protein n=1 Tax=Microthlaspi erraticum TaxID=1685480 RepID=A0A6D2HR95_9BRAS|nr:unnamed protein product [Microthlaspi erraticum]